MIAVDTNILVYAHREDAPFHQKAYACIERLAEGRTSWAIPWPCVHEFLAIVTHPRIFMPPTPLERAIDQVMAWLESPTLRMLGEEVGYFEVLRDVLSKSGVSGAKVHDGRVAALCIFHGVAELWTADRDFSRFGRLRTRNPLVEP